MQAIAFILSERQEGSPEPRPALVVAPASLIYNWEAEIRKFAPQLKALVIAGTKQERRELLSRINRADAVSYTHLDVYKRQQQEHQCRKEQ